MELTEEHENKKYVSDRIIMLCLYAGALVIHILMTLCTTIFNLTPDEYSVTAVAAYANGFNWHSTVSTGGYYGYFQSIFYIPTFWVTDDPYLRYRLMLIINGIFVSLVPVIVYWLSRRAFDVKRAAAVLFALICGWYPCYMLLTKYTWNETMCILLPWIFVLLIYKSLGCENTVKKQIFSVLAGLSLVAAYATHGRMLALLAAGIVLQIVVFFSMKKTRIFCFSGFYAAIAAGFVGDFLIKRYIQGVLWNVNAGQTPTNTIEKMFSKLFQVSSEAEGLSSGTITGLGENVSLSRFANTLIGHFFYFISSTWGFGAICVVAVITAIVLYYKKRPSPKDIVSEEKSEGYINNKTMIFMWFTLLAMGAIFVVSVAFKSTSTLYAERMDTVIYGRYTEIFYPIAILAGMLVIYKKRFGLGQSFAALCFAAAINVLTMIFVVPIVTGGDRLVSAMIMGIAPLRYGEAMKDLFTESSFIKIIATTMSLLFVWLVIKLIRRADKNLCFYFSLPLAGLLLYSNAYCYTSYTIPQSKSAQNGATYMSQAIDLIDSGFDSVTCYNLARERYVKAQFLYPELNIQIVTSASKLRAADELPDIILAQNVDSLGLLIDGAYLVGSVNNNVQVFACTQEAVEWARAQGLRVSESGMVSYTAAELPATTHVIKNGHDENADMNYENPDEDSVTAVLTNGAAVYTNYMNLSRKGSYLFTIEGNRVSGGKIALTADKGATVPDYEIIAQGDNLLCVRLEVTEALENVRFKLSGSSGEPVEVYSLTVEYEADLD